MIKEEKNMNNRMMTAIAYLRAKFGRKPTAHEVFAYLQISDENGVVMKTKKYWIGKIPSHCQICHRPLSNFFVDGKTLSGAWSIQCVACHVEYGVGLGVGKGQKYNLKGEKI